MAKPAKKNAPAILQGTLVRFTGYSNPEMQGDTFVEGDLIHITTVADKELEGPLGGVLVERDGQNMEATNQGEEIYMGEFEVIGTYAEWKSQNERSAEPETADEEVVDDTVSKPKKNSKKAPKAEESKELAIQAPATHSIEAELVPADTNQLMTYLNRTDLHEAAKDLARVRYVSETVLGGVLAKIYNDRLFEKHIDMQGEAPNFETYLKEHFGDSLHYRKAMRLVKGYNFLNKNGLDVNLLCQLGYAKVNSLMRLEDRDPELIKDFAERAKKIGRDKLEEEIQATEVSSEEVSASDKKTKLITLKMSMYEDNYHEFQRILQQYKSDNGFEAMDDRDVLITLMQEFEQLSLTAAPSLEADQANFEARHGVKIHIEADAKK